MKDESQKWDRERELWLAHQMSPFETKLHGVKLMPNYTVYAQR